MSYERSDQNARERRSSCEIVGCREEHVVCQTRPPACAACACAGMAGLCRHGVRSPTGLYREVETPARVFGFWRRLWRRLRWTFRSRRRWAVLGKIGENLGIALVVGETPHEFRARARAAATTRGLEATVAGLDRLQGR